MASPIRLYKIVDD